MQLWKELSHCLLSHFQLWQLKNSSCVGPVHFLVAMLGGGFLWVCLGVAWDVLCSCGFCVPWVFSCLFVFFVLFSFFWRSLVYFLCTRVAHFCVF